MCVGSLFSTRVEAVLGVVLDGLGASGVMVEVEVDLPKLLARGARCVSFSSGKKSELMHRRDR
jgi:hypothetical protein